MLLKDGSADPVVVGFLLAEAAEAPPAVGDAVDEGKLAGAGGAEVVLEGAEGFLEVGGIFAFQNGVAGGEPVFQAVVTDGGLTLGGAGAGGKLGVAPIGVNATLAGHVWSTP